MIARMQNSDQPPKIDPKQSGTPLHLYIAFVGIGAVAIAAIMAVVMMWAGKH